MRNASTEPKLSADQRRNAELDQMLNEALMQTFPCSDPVSISVPRADRAACETDVSSTTGHCSESHPPVAAKA